MKFDYCPLKVVSPMQVKSTFFSTKEGIYHLYSVNLLGHRTLYIRYCVRVEMLGTYIK